MKQLVLLTTLLSAFFFILPNSDSATKRSNSLFTPSGTEYVPGELLVKYRRGAQASNIQGFQTRFGINTIKRFRYIGASQVKLPPDLSVEAALELYREDPNVEYAEPNYLRFTSARVPNDEYFEELWSLNNTGQEVNGKSGIAGADIDAVEAWDITTGSSSIVIAVIDTGIDYNHPDLSGNIWSNADEEPNNGIDDDGNSYVDDLRGWDFYDNDNDPIDSYGHGTLMAGIIAAEGNNNIGVAGVCWSAKIMPLRAGNAFGELNVSEVVSAVEYAIEKGAKIINASFSGTDYSEFEKDAIFKANGAGIIFVAAAGNDGTDNDISPYYPAGYDLDNIIAVAATDQNDELTDYSNYGSTSVDVGAPGENIFSTQAGRKEIWSDNLDNIIGWETDGTWGLTTLRYDSPPYSLTDSPVGDYSNETESWAMTPEINISSCRGILLNFDLRGTSQSNKDFLYIQTSTDASNWTYQDTLIGSTVYSGISGDFSDRWHSAYVDLGAYDGESAVFIRFYFVTDPAGTADGWYIDDLRVTASSNSYSGTEYRYVSGTSPSAPHVAGLAGLVLSQNAGLTKTEVKSIIMDSVDDNDSLRDRTVAGGRINALNALNTTATSPSTGGGGDSCFIATVAFGSSTESHVMTLRDFRDIYLLNNRLGQAWISIYYKYSPPLAEYIAEHDILKTYVRTGLLPIIWLTAILLNKALLYKIILLFSLFVLAVCLLVWNRGRKKPGMLRV